MASRADFGALTEGSVVAETFKHRITGRVVVITGVSPKSLGGKVATIIAQHGPARLILASRGTENLKAIAEKIKQVTSARLDLIELDLASLESTRHAAKAMANLTTDIHLLINTAAVVSSDKRLTKDGLEIQFGVTHIGHFLLTNLLLPQLRHAAQHSKSGSVRIINVSSHGHRLSPFRFHDYNFDGKQVPLAEQAPQSVPTKFRPSAETPYVVWAAYGQSKTANILHAMALNERLDRDGIRSYALHPGSIKTDLSRNLTPEDEATVEGTSAIWVSLDQGTSTILVAALDPSLDVKQDNVYLADCQMSKAAAHARNAVAAEELWELSERLVAPYAKVQPHM